MTSAPGQTHDHDLDDHPLEDTPIEDNPLWQQDNVVLVSVGIDVGSSGTQVVFTRLHLRRFAEDLTSRFVVVERTPLYRSPVWFTPYLDAERIDAAALGSIVDEAYAAARQHPDQVDTGVVILTGEAARRTNAEPIAAVLADRAGEFVCATAGHHMEARLAAYGSGAARASHETGQRILNVDIGGGTTKLAVVSGGQVEATAALSIGGRLQVVDSTGHLVRLEPTGRANADRAGFTWSLGDAVRPADLDTVAESMATALTAAITGDPATADLWLTDPIGSLAGIDGVLFSGGVAEYVYGSETRDFGDLGRRLGAALRRRLDADAWPFPLLPAGECIRATVLGASSYSVQLSGSTSYISAPERLLPHRNLQVVRPNWSPGPAIDPTTLAQTVRTHLASFDLDGTETAVALALNWTGPPSYERLSALARGVRHGLAARIDRNLPVFLVLDGDVALSLGSILRDELGVTSDLLVLDGLRLWDLDYVDLGPLRLPSNTVPVTIKSLVFGG